MTFLLNLTFFLLLIIIFYYFIYYEKLNKDNLFTIILNIIFVSIFPIYYFYFKDYPISLIISILLLFSAFSINIKIKEVYHNVKIPSLIYFLTTAFIVGFMLKIVL